MSRDRVAAYCAAIWAICFAAPHVYWASGRKEGLNTALSQSVVDDAGLGFALMCGGIALFCLCGAGVALATQFRFVPRWERAARRALMGLVWFAAVLLIARSVMVFVLFNLPLTGVTDFPDTDHADYLHMARWFMFLWWPWFVLGAVSWTWLGWRYSRPHRRADLGAPALP